MALYILYYQNLYVRFRQIRSCRIYITNCSMSEPLTLNPYNHDNTVVNHFQHKGPIVQSPLKKLYGSILGAIGNPKPPPQNAPKIGPIISNKYIARIPDQGGQGVL